MTEQMERLSIDEIIAHCERNVQKNETTMSKEQFEKNEMDSWFMREYWEHRQVAEYLKEIQQYRELEKKLNGISVEQVVNGFIEQVEKGTAEGYERGRILTNKEADDWNKYRAIGTVEKIKKQLADADYMAKKSISIVVDRNSLIAYQKLGTVQELETAKEYIELAQKCRTVSDVMKTLIRYEKIGTVEEFKALKEKAEPKPIKPRKCGDCNDDECILCDEHANRCPNCEVSLDDNHSTHHKHCPECGQKLEWT